MDYWEERYTFTIGTKVKCIKNHKLYKRVQLNNGRDIRGHGWVNEKMFIIGRITKCNSTGRMIYWPTNTFSNGIFSGFLEPVTEK